MLSKITQSIEKLMQKQGGHWQNVKFWNSHLPTNAPECICKGTTVPEQWHLVMVFTGMFDGIKKNIYSFDLLESFSNGTSWLDLQGISYTKILIFTALVLLLDCYFSWFNSLLCNSQSFMYLLYTHLGRKETWGLKLQPQMGQSHGSGSVSFTSALERTRWWPCS